MTVNEILASVQYVVDRDGQQTAVQLDLSVWKTIQQMLEDIEDIADFEQAQQEEDGAFAWEQVVQEYQAKHT
ncbi:hypothetical protein [Candidatus Leptofilum sp.]|uniref:hypothetical protein n=1 Tax=Candidatus Leptofilum sp. TaxID=3241576 RepID=UPI003B5A598F